MREGRGASPVAGAFVVLALALSSTDAHAIRPFVTDDARVVGQGHIQLETYVRRDRLSLQHWLLPAVGPTDWIELTLGAVHGLDNLRKRPELPRYSLAGPLLQGKFLLIDSEPNKPPSLAVVVGSQLPAGRGSFQPPGWGGFTYLAATQAFIKEDDFLIHANVGVSTFSAPGIDPARVTWGIGTQVETWYDFHLIGEIFSGDPYTQGTGGSYQLGFRIIFNDHLQLDGTWGGGLWGTTLQPLWFSSGVRIVSHKLF